jgi:hypothetical protein
VLRQYTTTISIRSHFSEQISLRGKAHQSVGNPGISLSIYQICQCLHTSGERRKNENMKILISCIAALLNEINNFLVQCTLIKLPPLVPEKSVV